MRDMIRVVLGTCLLFIVGASLAGTASVSGTAPAQYTDGTPLPASDITGYNVRCSSFTPTGSTTPGTCSTPSPTFLPGSTPTGTITLIIPASGGKACINLASVVSTTTTPSAWTNDACKDFPALVPNPPSGVTIAVIIDVSTLTPVYTLTPAEKMGTYMGMIDVGKTCYGPNLFTYRGATFKEVWKGDVHLWTDTSSRLAAPCIGA